MKGLILFLFLFVSCSNNKANDFNNTTDEEEIQIDDIIDDEDVQKYIDQTEEYPDGTYCAEVEYYNPTTGTRKTYNLNVDVEDGNLTVIHWLNGGWLDNTHFFSTDISDGDCDFTSDRGYRYTVELKEFGGCSYTDEYKIRRDVNEEIESTTCPRCSGEKSSYDDYCDNCQSELENEDN